MIPKEFQQVEIAIAKKASAIFVDETKMRQIGQELAKKIVGLIIERILAGYDLFSRKFGGYNVSYKKEKAYKYAVAKYGKTKWASSSTRDKLRLTGNLLSSLEAKVVGVQVGFKQVIFRILITTKDPTQIPKIQGLQSETGVARNHKTYAKKAYLFMGLALSGQWKNKEEQEIRNFLIEKMKGVFQNRMVVRRA